MSVRCPPCGGQGYQTYEEDGREVMDACYHCGTTGFIDDELYFLDRLGAVAGTLAYHEESEYRQACNDDPCGEGYDFLAAENMLRGHEYFQMRCWERSDRIMAQLEEMSLADQELLIAWNEMPREERDTIPSPPPVMSEDARTRPRESASSVAEPSEVCDYCFMEFGHTARCPYLPKEQCGAGDDDIPF